MTKKEQRMQNNFEKKVQEKMDELQFSPSAPVWANVEKAIRRKKERRRLLLWLPLLALLFGGLWWVTNESGNRQPNLMADEKKESNAVAQSSQPDGSTPSLQKKETTQPSEVEKPSVPVNEKLSEHTGAAVEEAKVQPKETLPSGDAFTYQPSIPNAKKAGKTKPRPSTPGKNVKHLTTSIGRNADAAAPSTKAVATERSLEKDRLQSTSSSSPVQALPPERALMQTETQTEIKSQHQDSAAATEKSEAVKEEAKTSSADSAAQQPKPQPKKEQQKWKIALQAGVGTSGLANGLNLFGNKRENLSFSSPVTNPTTVGNPTADRRHSSVQNSWSFSVGLDVQRQLSSRLSFSAGLRYRYFSNSFATGTFVRQDTVVRFGNNINGFYANSGTAFFNHTNHFHFIALPLALRWQMLKKKPLHLEGGLALQQLLSTNYLIYDSGSNVYYSDNSQLNKLQLTASLGMDYRILQAKNFSLATGPQLLYSFSRVDKTGNDGHLFSAGLSLRLQLEKKK
jgi:hypothetical protein